jgi:hypothetical protein
VLRGTQQLMDFVNSTWMMSGLCGYKYFIYDIDNVYISIIVGIMAVLLVSIVIPNVNAGGPRHE